MSGPHKVTAPIARSTAYDFNCHLSQSHTGDPRSRHGNEEAMLGKDTSGEVLNVMPHEFLFEVVGGRQQNAARMKAKSSLNGVVLEPAALAYMNRAAYDICGDACEFSTIAGRKAMKIHLEQNKSKVKHMNQALNRYIRYVGVAVTGIEGGPATAAQRQGFSATRGGLMTVVHRGGEPIPAGSRVRMEFDIMDILQADTGHGWIDTLHGSDRESGGVPRTKILPRLIRVHDEDEAVYDIKEAIAGIRKGYTVHALPGLLMPLPFQVERGALRFTDLSA